MLVSGGIDGKRWRRELDSEVGGCVSFYVEGERVGFWILVFRKYFCCISIGFSCYRRVGILGYVRILEFFFYCCN